ncbi:unnamed protein product [Paramecium octaurelia]|uniref:Transmembrane protein n=1 Tax=Paramecium octaurelia TaxID=43137 RepID=A0A8S1WBX2_PAROT|nr:unnamed protein product [Paramecium octaurelia]
MQNNTPPIDFANLHSKNLQQQIFSQNQEQILSYNQYSQDQENQIAFSKSDNLIKDVDFNNQRIFLLKIIGIFIIWSLIFFLSLYLFGLNIKQSNEPLSQILIFLSLTFLILLMRMGIRNQNRNPLKSCLIFFGLLIFYNVLYISLFSSLQFADNNQVNVDTIVGTILLICVSLNFLVNIIVLAYLLVARERIRMLYVIALEIAILIFLCIFYNPAIIMIPFGFPYTYCLIKTLQQILNGKFSLKQNQVISGAIATFFGLFNICNEQYRDL